MRRIAMLPRPPVIPAVTLLMVTTTTMASSGTDALLDHLGLGCRNQVIEQFDAPDSDVTIRLGATLQDNLDSGTMTMKDLKEYGASFDWNIDGKDTSGYCNVDGEGRVTEFKAW